MKVVEWRDRVGFRVWGNTYKTPSAAANAVAKAKTNGWIFWGLEGTNQKTTRTGRRKRITVIPPDKNR